MLPEIKTILLAMTPINELRGTIPLAIGLWDLNPLKAFGLAVIGNMIPVFFLLWFWPGLSGFLIKKSRTAQKFFNWLWQRTYRKFYKKHSLYGDLALILLVAIPLPFTGAWTGTVAAFLFKIPYGKSLGLIFLGVVIAGIVVTLASLGIFSLI
jgi:uncharacterized membrane protein